MTSSARLAPRLLPLLLLVPAVALASGEPLPPADARLLERLVVAEAGGEGELGMALVARSVLNRVALLRSGAVQPQDYLASGSSLRGVIYARGQYQPVSDGGLDRPRSAEQLAAAARAIALARDTEALRARLRAQGLGDAAIDRLLRATGFRTHSAFRDQSQSYARESFGGHAFNGDGLSTRADVLAAFERAYGAGGRTRGIAGAISGAGGSPGAVDEGSTAPGGPFDLAASRPAGERPAWCAPGGPAPADLQGPVPSGSAQDPLAAYEEGYRMVEAWDRAPGVAGAGQAPPATGRPPFVSTPVAPAPSPSAGECAPGSAPWWDALEHPTADPAGSGVAFDPRRAVTWGELSTGSSGLVVVALQRRLKLAETGRFGPVTRRALQVWQRSHGLPGTGALDAATAQRLDATRLEDDRAR